MMNKLTNFLSVISSILVIITFIYQIAVPEFQKHYLQNKKKINDLDKEADEKITDLLKIAKNDRNEEIKLLTLLERVLRFNQVYLYPNSKEDKYYIEILNGSENECITVFPCEIIFIKKTDSYYVVSLVYKTIFTNKKKNKHYRKKTIEKIKTINGIIEYNNKSKKEIINENN